MTVASEREAEDRAFAPMQPRRLIVSLFGLYARERGGWLSVASLVRLMADLGIDAQAVRSAVSRLKRRGLLEAERCGRTAGYRLSASGADILAEGDSRIFDRHRGRAEEGWLLVVFSVPETERDKRHQMRRALSRLGLGAVAPGVWIAPAHLEAAVASSLDRLGLRSFTDLFRTRDLGSRSLSENVRRWWNLDALREQYAEFLDHFGPMAGRWQDEGDRDRDRAFADFVTLVTVWRRLPYLDPGLPLEALPDGWEGVAAETLFSSLRARLSDPARQHVISVIGPER